MKKLIIKQGTIQTFCRNKGHGFIKPDNEEELLFLHVIDIEGEWVPKEGIINSIIMINIDLIF
jgi:cold shock CspA family protein